MAVAFPGESAEYREARARLLKREIELRRAMEEVAASRRALPPGGPVPEDYVFQGSGDAEHAGQHINLVVVAKTALPRLLTFGPERGWRRLRLLSSAANTYNRDYHAETAQGAQRPMLNVFHRDQDAIRPPRAVAPAGTSS